ncbi:hypothetical protein QQP08_006230 [Theobroma cacao]|nr:hypothetical protein QQP08_006230 [Theobroma cacao]
MFRAFVFKMYQNSDPIQFVGFAMTLCSMLLSNCCLKMFESLCSLDVAFPKNNKMDEHYVEILRQCQTAAVAADTCHFPENRLGS